MRLDNRNRMDVAFAVWLSAVWLLLLQTTAGSASFSCAGPHNAIETSICDDPHLSRLDSELAAVFRQAFAGPRKMTVLLEQRQWLASRASKCRPAVKIEVPCLREVYARRLTDLRSMIARQEPSGDAICRLAADRVRRDNGLILHDAPRSSTPKDPEPFLFGRVQAMSDAFKAKIRAAGDDSVTDLTLSGGFLIEIQPQQEMFALESVSGGTMPCEQLNIFRSGPDGTAMPVGNPSDPTISTWDGGCPSYDFGQGPDGAPTFLAVFGDRTIMDWVFTRWHEQGWGGACGVHAHYAVTLQQDFADCRATVNCSALAQSALAWATAWNALKPPFRSHSFSDLKTSGASDGNVSRHAVPTFEKDFDSAFKDFDGGPVFSGNSAAGRVKIRISHPYFGDRREDGEINVGLYRENGTSLGGFQFEVRRDRLLAVSTSKLN